MGDDCVVISESEICALKETLHEQQQLLQKMYSELDAEREASASAASEALAVILRLQSEKAAIAMESEQFKRMSEHKICHAEESLAIVEDISYQKEMEVAALEHQLQFYCRLLRLGCVDAEIRRSRSVSFPLKYDQALDSDNSLAGDDVQSYWEQIKKLGNRVKEIAEATQTGAGSSCNLWIRQPKGSPNSMKEEAWCDQTSVHDVFEVPQFGKSGVIHPEEEVEVLDNGMKSNPIWLRKKARLKRRRNRVSFTDHSRFAAIRTTESVVEVSELKEMREQLKSLQNEVRSWKEKEKEKKPHSREQGVSLSLHSLQEAMLEFWL